MAKITRIKASDGPKKPEHANDEKAVVRKRVSVADKKSEKAKVAKRREAEKKVGESKKGKKEGSKREIGNFWLFRPFVALGRYVKGAWGELRQVRWPDRKTTWKMLLAVIVYSLIFVVIISLLDMFFGWLFKLILGR